MIRKLIWGGIATAVVSAMIFGRDFGSYARTAVQSVRDTVKSEITPEFELARIRTEITQLEPDIRKHMRQVAEYTVSVRDLERKVAGKEARIQNQAEAILSMRDVLETDAEEVRWKRVSYRKGELQRRLATQFSAYKVAQTSLERDRQLLSDQRQILLANEQKLNLMMAEKEDLAVAVSQLEARLKTIQATEAAHDMEVDETRLTEVKDMISTLNHELDVRESLLQMEGHLHDIESAKDEISASVDDLAAEIDAHFGLNGEIDSMVSVD